VLIYIGSSAGGDGISVFSADADGELTLTAAPVAVEAPMHLTRHPVRPVMYAANTLDDGAVTALRIGEGGALEPFSRQLTGGAQPVYAAVAPDGQHLICTNWGGMGGVSVLALGADGSIGGLTDFIAPSEDVASYAHHVSLSGDEATIVFLGLSEIRGYGLADTGTLVHRWTAPAQDAEAGPRHLVRHPSGRRYVSDELASAVSAYDPDPSGGGLRHAGARPASLAKPVSLDRNHPSELALSADGRFLYVANRGPDTISVFAVAGDTLDLVGETPTGGVFPQHFALADPWIYVAHERSHDVALLRRDPDTGLLTSRGTVAQVTNAAFVLAG
jgi:6-phosphogluconolactonase (cycloisomerase 2 family)